MRVVPSPGARGPCRTLARPGLPFMLSRGKRGEQLQMLLSETVSENRFPVVAVSDNLTNDASEYLLSRDGVMNVGGQELQVANDARPSHASMDTQAKVLLLSHFVVTVGRHLSQATAA